MIGGSSRSSRNGFFPVSCFPIAEVRLPFPHRLLRQARALRGHPRQVQLLALLLDRGLLQSGAHSVTSRLSSWS